MGPYVDGKPSAATEWGFGCPPGSGSGRWDLSVRPSVTVLNVRVPREIPVSRAART
ncbi:hypothetical protein GCM10010266_43630 [Streptomyces griseomycini]|nr:hypothetical protein GCM10010266_43630 [Streptomyces griseomycini]GGR28857.1 hypothetical protein GCM10015536_38180 [Streptomyces griseomycini]